MTPQARAQVLDTFLASLLIMHGVGEKCSELAKVSYKVESSVQSAVLTNSRRMQISSEQWRCPIRAHKILGFCKR